MECHQYLFICRTSKQYSHHYYLFLFYKEKITMQANPYLFIITVVSIAIASYLTLRIR